MRTLPATMIRVLAPFAPLFSERVWAHVRVLVAGAILAPRKRTVSSAPRAMGLDQERRFHRHHRLLSRAKWSGTEASRVLFGLLVEAFAPDGPLVVGVYSPELDPVERWFQEFRRKLSNKTFETVELMQDSPTGRIPLVSNDSLASTGGWKLSKYYDFNNLDRYQPPLVSAVPRNARAISGT